MTRANYDPSTGTIRADLAHDASRAQIHAGPEGWSVELQLTHTEAVHLRDQLGQAICRAERSKPGRPSWPN
jgi:hypothetical protein